ncbi:plasmid pRiA4b ORF-3 family protein [Variovorax sp. J22R133]|uniref:plasmid pRiA4b ORF-3 family protein n=1 Tax=Variovorax brevis TaxID=3053503 RepID=UPI0025765519|nr:plasmid pRiA4b ORF-3 family protein [Variovorax sp. J22R133]MDM0118012.1 plasmid pRiA4b ORF-3 family protein [Variovorax sp. J22R133]
MEAGSSSGPEVLQLRAVVRSISPLIWRRLLVRGDTSVARLHQILQVAFGWQDMHLHGFEIRGREYGVHQEGGVFFDTDAHKALIGHLKLRRLERFTYEYDFGDLWVHDLRIEALPLDIKRVYPVCIAGRRAAPPEDCGGPHAFMATRFDYTLIGESRSRQEFEDLLDDEVEDEEWAILRHYQPDRFDRRAVNRRLAALAAPSQER